IEEIQATLDRARVAHGGFFSERSLHERGALDGALALLEEGGSLYRHDGAVWLRTSLYGDDKDRVLRRSSGELTYFASDIAYHYDKLIRRGFDLAIDIWGADHHGYIKRMEAGVEFLRQAEHFEGKLRIVVTQLVRLTRGGQEVKMSKRAGTYVTLDELLAEVPSDVARFFFVMRGWDTHMDFDLDLAKEQSQKNPVYYLKYAYARVAGILRQAGRGARKKDADLTKLTESAEFTLIQELAAFPEVVRQTAEDYQIQRVPHYALGVADAFHKFYEQCRVVSDDKELTAARLRLVEATKLVLEQVGETVGIELPEKL
ncbi:MAG: arginine--tRNA ligase, partial [bacterium]|nr:arginine--tRNA ligase [bacterium]